MCLLVCCKVAFYNTCVYIACAVCVRVFVACLFVLVCWV